MVVETDVTIATPVVLPATCCKTAGGLAFGAATLPTIGVETGGTVLEGKVLVLETILPDVGA